MKTRSIIGLPTTTLTLRVTAEERELFKRAARLSDRSTGRLIVHCAKPGASAIIAEAEGAAITNT